MRECICLLCKFDQKPESLPRINQRLVVYLTGSKKQKYQTCTLFMYTLGSFPLFQF